MQDRQNDDAPIDVVTLQYELERQKMLESTGGVGYMASLIDGVPDRPDPEHYAKMVRDLARSRRLYHAGAAALAAIVQKEPVDDVISQLEGKILGILHDGKLGGARSMGDVARSFLDNFQAVCECDRPCIGMRTSLPVLDAMTTGLRGGDYTIVAGRTGQGKSTFIQQIAMANARDGHKVYVASLEMTSEMFMGRGISMITGIAHDDIRDPRYLGREDRNRIKEAAALIAEWPWIVDDTAGLELHELLARIRAQINRGAELVLIDYLQMIQCREYQKIYDKVSAVSAALRDLAKTAKIPVVAACQLRRPQQGHENTRPSVYDMKESGSIENDASNVFLIYRHIDKESDSYSGKDEVIVAKQRQGRTGTIEVTFVGQSTKFEPRYSDNERE
jgi:replicative DNA helicase